jgi:hypothetical protein
MDWGCRRGWAAGRRRESERSGDPEAEEDGRGWVGLLSFFFSFFLFSWVATIVGYSKSFRLRLRARVNMKVVPPAY